MRFDLDPYWQKKMVENITKNNLLLERLKANSPKPKPLPWYTPLWNGFCVPFRAMSAFWLVASGQGYIRRFDEDDDEL